MPSKMWDVPKHQRLYVLVKGAIGVFQAIKALASSDITQQSRFRIHESRIVYQIFTENST